MYVLYVCMYVCIVTDGDRYTNGYNDTLQIPLQPLMDNLEVRTVSWCDIIVYVCEHLQSDCA